MIAKRTDSPNEQSGEVARDLLEGFEQTRKNDQQYKGRYNMLDLVKKGILTGIGLASLTKDKIEDLAEEIIEEGKLSEKEGRKLVEDLLKESDEARKNLEEEVKKTVGDALEKLDRPSKKDFEDLEARIKTLEEQMNDFEDLEARVKTLEEQIVTEE